MRRLSFFRRTISLIFKKEDSTKQLFNEQRTVTFPIPSLKPLVYTHDELSWHFDSTRTLFPTNMVTTLVLRKLRMRKQNTNRAVPLDAVPERRTKRCSPRFRPGDRFCELSFRYLSPGIEGEKCRPLDHM